MKVQPAETVPPPSQPQSFKKALGVIRRESAASPDSSSAPGPVAPPRAVAADARATVTVSAGTVPGTARGVPRPGAVVQGSPHAAHAPVVHAQVNAQAAAHTASVARGRLVTEAHRLEDVRAHHSAAARAAVDARTEDMQERSQLVNERAVDAIIRELVSAFGPGPSKVANDPPPSSASPAPLPALASPAPASEAAFRQDHQTKAAQAVALIEKIEVFVRSGQRPSLSLTLNNSLGAWVEIEKVADGKVALKLVGQRGPPSPDVVARIRDELRGRGLDVASLSVA